MIYYYVYATLYCQHLYPIYNAALYDRLGYFHLGRDVNYAEADKSLTQEKMPSLSGESGWYDLYIYTYGDDRYLVSDYVVNPVESIAFGQETYYLNLGESTKLSPIIAPSDASQQAVTWASSDEDIVTVDIFGNVTLWAKGEATITATTTDGTDLSATCTVAYSESGINNVLADSETSTFVVYNLQGMLVLKTEDITKVKALPAGYYIVNGKKIAIR